MQLTVGEGILVTSIYFIYYVNLKINLEYISRIDKAYNYVSK